MTITMYSLPAEDCRACWSTEKRMNHHQVDFKKIRLDQSDAARKEIEHLGYSSAPVVVVTDQAGKVVDHWSGFRESKIAGYKKVA